MQKKIKHEEIEQKALIQRCNLNPITRDYLFAIPNGGSRHLIEARNLVLQGVKKGVPDLFLAYPSEPYHGLFIELKRREKKIANITKEQKQWIARLNAVHYLAVVAYGWEEAWDVIHNYLQ